MSDLNTNYHIFGGWVLAQMDIAGGIVSSRVAKGKVATVAIEAMKFYEPIMVGDVVTCYAEPSKIGTTSVHIHIEVFVTRRGTNKEIMVTDGTYVFVALDDDGKPRKIPKE
jgi:acyl-CoA thioesterase YciA